jgi:nickel-dependent lactate racemase
MSFRLKYGKGEITFRLGRERRVKVISPPGSDRPESDREVGARDLLAEALKHPLASASLADLASGARRVVISIPDGTRPPVARQILSDVLDEILRSGVDLHNISIFVASGAHSGAREEDLRHLVGDGVSPAIPIHQNYSRRASDFKLVGITGRGTPIMLNNLLLEADLNVVIGAVAFHYFAGMAGGRKMIVPGACHVETVRANHRLTLNDDGMLHPMCRNGSLEGNPVHEDMVEGMNYLGNIFLINAVLDGWGKVREITCGNGVASHLEAVRRAKHLLAIPIGERCDLAIASAGGYPFDINVIQTHKAIDHAAESVRDGGVLVVAAECSGGIGSDSFLPWFGVGDARAVSRKLLTQYELNGHTALALMKKTERIKIILVSSLDRAAVGTMGMTSGENLDEALAQAEACVGKAPLTYVFPTAWGILPVLEV